MSVTLLYLIFIPASQGILHQLTHNLLLLSTDAKICVSRNYAAQLYKPLQVLIQSKQQLPNHYIWYFS